MQCILGDVNQFPDNFVHSAENGRTVFMYVVFSGLTVSGFLVGAYLRTIAEYDL